MSVQKIETTAGNILRHGANWCFRSSGTFLALCGAGLDTHISMLNLWLLKRDISHVTCALSLRALDGTLVTRRFFPITDPKVYGVSIAELAGGPFVGSVEVEVFSGENLFVPYCAIIATYRTAKGLCQLHSYARTYNPHELEQAQHAILTVNEGGWTLRDDAHTRSFIALHNGPDAVDGPATVRILNHCGEQRSFTLGVRLPPFATLLIEPADHMDIAAFLEGRLGQGTITLPRLSAFPRGICGNLRRDASGATTDLQATHTNFNYRAFELARLPAGEEAVTVIPYAAPGERMELVVYPDFAETPGLEALTRQGAVALDGRCGVHLPVEGGERVTFRTAAPCGLPDRLVNGIAIAATHSDNLPGECSLGIMKRSTFVGSKHWHWGLGFHPGGRGDLSVAVLENFVSRAGSRPTVFLRLYDEEGPCGEEDIPLDRLRGEAVALERLLSRQPHGAVWYQCSADYTGTGLYNVMRDDVGRSVCLEHGF